MQDTEKYLFDLNGYLVVKNTLTAQEVHDLNRVVDRHRIDELLDSAHYFHTGLPDEMIGNQDPSRGPVDVENGSLLDWVQKIRDLIDHPQIMPYLQELLPPGFRLDHSYGVFARKGARKQVGLALHHGGAPYNHRHWNFQVCGGYYSYVRAAAGYATFESTGSARAPAHIRSAGGSTRPREPSRCTTRSPHCAPAPSVAAASRA